MKNVVILVNGTWNDDDIKENISDKRPVEDRMRLTNVFWLKELCPNTPAQTVWYSDGVGTHGFIDKAVGGAFGLGLKKGICGAYRGAAEGYASGDRLFFFGFSRGAYTVRTAVDMIASVGLARLNDIPESERDDVVERLYDLYRGNIGIEAVSDVSFHDAASAAEAAGCTPIHFVGVWDTVGTAGIPDQYGFLDQYDAISREHYWHNTELSPVVQNARHAIGMDEMRESFVPSFWTDAAGDMRNDDVVKQLWFSGVHTDIGGGYENRDLGNVTMRWMTLEAIEKGLIIDDAPVRPLPEEEPLGPVNDSMTYVFEKMWSRPRGVPNVSDLANSHLFHPSVLTRYGNAGRPALPDWECRALDSDQTCTAKAKAVDRWTPLNVFLEPEHTYEITAEGQWNDASMLFGPDGTLVDDGPFRYLLGKAAHAAVDLWAEHAAERRKSEPHRRFPLTWRCPESKGFMLMGVVADGRGVVRTGDLTLPEPHTRFGIGAGVKIGAGTDHPLKRGGYLYCFPNDVWNKYDNNEGEMDISVRRL